MCRRLLLVLSLFLATSVSGQSLNVRGQDIEVIDGEEYAVYSAIATRYEDALNGKSAELLVINDSTQATSKERCLPEIMFKREEYVSMFPPEFLPDLDSIIDDFKRKNAKAHILTRSLNIRTRYVFINRKEFDAVYPSRDEPWKGFYEMYPRSSGYMTLSRVGFNSEKTRAIVYIEILCGFLCADGSYIALIKDNGVWKELAAPNCWVS